MTTVIQNQALCHTFTFRFLKWFPDERKCSGCLRVRSSITPSSPESDVQPWGKLNFYCPNLLFTLLAISLVLSQLPHTNPLFSPLCLICQPFGVVISPSSVFTCRLTWLAHIRTALKTLFRGAGPRIIGWNVQESQEPSMSCCGSTFKTFPRRTLPDWILACDASCMLMKSSSSSWTLQTHSHTETCVTWNNECFLMTLPTWVGMAHFQSTYAPLVKNNPSLWRSWHVRTFTSPVCLFSGSKIRGLKFRFPKWNRCLWGRAGIPVSFCCPLLQCPPTAEMAFTCTLNARLSTVGLFLFFGGG